MNVLFLTHRLPYSPNRGDRIRAYHLLRVLSQQASVQLVSLAHDREEADQARALASLAESVTVLPVPRVKNLVAGALALPGERPLTHVLLESPGMVPALHRIVRQSPPDVVLAYCSSMALHALRPPLSGVPFILDMVDVDSQKWATLAKSASFPLRLVYAREADRLRRFETTAAAHAYATTVVNERECASMQEIAPGASVHVIENGIDMTAFRPATPPSSEPRVVFCGVFNYEPNETAAYWLATEVWPIVLSRRPDARLSLVGMHPTKRVRALASATIEVTGKVPDVKPYLWRSAVAVAPLHVARGLQNKVLEAVAAGLPCVVTSPVFDGLPPRVRASAACRLAVDAETFAHEIVSVLELPGERRRELAESGDLGELTWERQLAPMYELLRAAAGQTSATASVERSRVGVAVGTNAASRPA